jgi:hypothetical protein
VEGAESSQDPKSAEPRKVIGARTWEEKTASGELSHEDLASTQIIPNMGDDAPSEVGLPTVESEVGTSQASPKEVPTAGKVPPKSQPKQPVAPKAEEPAEGSQKTERDLLDELKAVVNKKFDELVQ